METMSEVHDFLDRATGVKGHLIHWPTWGWPYKGGLIMYDAVRVIRRYEDFTRRDWRMSEGAKRLEDLLA